VDEGVVGTKVVDEVVGLEVGKYWAGVIGVTGVLYSRFVGG